MEQKLETTKMGLGFRLIILGLYWDNGKENGYCIIVEYILGRQWKRKWKLLYYNGISIGAILG